MFGSTLSIDFAPQVSHFSHYILPPSLFLSPIYSHLLMVRIKQRYILFEVLTPPTEETWQTFSESVDSALLHLHQVSSEEINPKRLVQVIRQVLQDHYGDYGAGSAGSLLVVKYFSPRTSTGIIRCGRQHVEMIVAVLALITRLGEKEVIMRSVHVSGTIKKCEVESIKRDKKNILCLQKKGK